MRKHIAEPAKDEQPVNCERELLEALKGLTYWAEAVDRAGEGPGLGRDYQAAIDAIAKAEPAKEVQPTFKRWADEVEAQLKAALAANADLLEVMDEIDATLCACRYDNKQGCNCDIHAVHNIIRALKSREK